ncbi:fasciclin domain-containing protein [Terrimonas pollutisoli]|uniref:fasciclin domain-containing protein n=1 Tax=Terrimonas pollutisoli TaxID=3034147 RepID=UPI0023EC198F|nr:fasciclin domain-containing protein [Terrimonas sp. H1YJ31]
MATIIQIANADRNLSLFSKGIKLADLEGKLNEIGPFTILGPVNLALSRLMSMTYDQLLEPGNKNKLVDFLSGYIISGKKMLADFRNDQRLSTLQGKMVTTTIKNGDIHINGAKILAKDRQGANGVIHLLGGTYIQ